MFLRHCPVITITYRKLLGEKIKWLKANIWKWIFLIQEMYDILNINGNLAGKSINYPMIYKPYFS
jgi:hypothetical protein